MQKYLIGTVILYVSLYIGVTAVRAEVPALINYQGYLTGSNGQPLTGDYDMVFTIYDHPTESAELNIVWQESHTGPYQVSVTDGQFTVLLGSVAALDDAVFAEPERYLGIIVGTDPEITPRARLGSAPYSMRVETVDGASGGNIFGDVNVHSTTRLGDLSGDNGTLEITNGLNVTLIAEGGSGAGSYLVLGNNTIDTAVKIWGDFSDAGYIDVRGADGSQAIELRGLSGKIIVRNPGSTGDVTIFGTESNGGAIWINDPNDLTTVSISAVEAGLEGAIMKLRDGNDSLTIVLDAQQGAEGASVLEMYDSDFETVEIDANDPDAGGGKITLRDNHYGNATVVLDAEAGPEGGGQITLRSGDDPAISSITLDAHDSPAGGGIISLKDNGGYETVKIDAFDDVGARMILSTVSNSSTVQTVLINANQGTAGGANISLRNESEVTTVRLDADYNATGKSRVITDVLEITGGSDLSERFEIGTGQTGVVPSPGMVVSIDPNNPGQLVVSSHAYDPAVAGIVSGAGGISTGMLMAQSGSVTDGTHAVALTGRVYCQADASYGPIRPGDLLTTSETPGHAMKVTDYAKSRGTILGKAMSSLPDGRGLVLVLVTLQ